MQVCCRLLYDFFSERTQSDSRHFEVLLAKRNTDDGDVEHAAKENVCQPDPYTANEKPDNVHQQIDAARLLFLFVNRRTEWPQTKNTQLESL